MKELKTKKYFQKRIAHFFLNEKWFNKAKLLRNMWDYKLGISYEMSPLLKQIISKDSIVLDIGANVGQYACRLNDIVKNGEGHIHSFEPVEENFVSLREMKEKLKLESVTLNKMGVSDKEGTATINIPMFDNGLVVATRATLQNIDGIKHREEEIKVTTIDDYVLGNDLDRVDFIKCDTEGNEINILNGGRETIRKHRPILSFEMSYDDKGIDWLLDLDYELYYYDRKARKFCEIKDYQDGNLIFINKKQKEGIEDCLSGC